MLNTDVGADGWLGNSYKTRDGYSREEAVEKYRKRFMTDSKTMSSGTLSRNSAVRLWPVGALRRRATGTAFSNTLEVSILY
ncbi:hypothetical protein [Halomicrococcus sp. NG-SE-24]|uniref:hypothetical protein n=1 Tax=Halomicrococcus sp. NG-SE-24 TaxID=3436928 RepID=UPI003D96BB57